MIAVSLLLFLALLFSLLFYGVGFNHLFLLVSSTSAVLALTLHKPQALVSFWRSHSAALIVAGLLLLALVAHQLIFTTIAETSYSPAWILATGPLWFIALALAGATNPGPDAPRASKPYLPMMAVAGLMALLVWVAGIRFLLWGERPKDPLADPTSFGILVYLVLVPSVHWWLCRKRSANKDNAFVTTVRIAFLVTVFLAFTVAFGTASRANVALLGLAVLLWLALGVAGKLNLRRAAGIACIGALGLIVASAQSSDVTTTLSQDLASDSATEQRWLLLEAGATLAQQHAPWGVGLFGFGLEYPAIRSPEDQTSAGIYVHNDYLQLAAEGGIILVVPLMLLVAGVLALALRQLRLLDAGQWCDPRAGGAVALGLCLLHACLTFVFYTLSVVLVMGIVAAWCFVPLRDAADTAPESPAPRKRLLPLLWWSGLGFAWLNIGYLAVDSTSLAVFSGQPGLPGTAIFRESTEQQRRFAKLATTLNGDRSLPVHFLAIDEANKARRDASERALLHAIDLQRQAIALEPRSSLGYLQIADLSARFRAGSDARVQAMSELGGLLDDGLGYLPNDLELLFAKFHWLEAQGEARPAFEFLYQRTLPWLDRYWNRSPEVTLDLFETLGSRALSLQDDAAFAVIRQARARLQAKKKPDSRLPGWLLRWLHGSSETAG